MLNSLYFDPSCLTPLEDPMRISLNWGDWWGFSCRNVDEIIFGELFISFITGTDYSSNILINIGGIEFLFPSWSYLQKSMFSETYVEVVGL